MWGSVPKSAVSRQASVPDLSSCRSWDERQAWNEPRLSFSSPSFWHGLLSRTLACRKCFFVSGENCPIAAEGHFFPTTHALCPVEIDLKTNWNTYPKSQSEFTKSSMWEGMKRSASCWLLLCTEGSHRVCSTGERQWWTEACVWAGGSKDLCVPAGCRVWGETVSSKSLSFQTEIL